MVQQLLGTDGARASIAKSGSVTSVGLHIEFVSKGIADSYSSAKRMQVLGRVAMSLSLNRWGTCDTLALANM